jgi:hypothetical protein
MVSGRRKTKSNSFIVEILFPLCLISKEEKTIFESCRLIK